MAVTLEHPQYMVNLPVQLDENSNILIAGCGTGSSVVYCINTYPGITIDAIDLSQTAIDQAKGYCEDYRKITFARMSIQEYYDNWKASKSPQYDYINCCGVLHHCEDPSKELNTLRKMLKDDGVMGLMVYGKYGRTSVYHIQELIKILGDEDVDERMENILAIYSVLPETNWFKQTMQGRFNPANKAELYDMFCHAHDVPYSIDELLAWLDRCDMEMLELTDPSEELLLDPSFYFKDRRMINKLMALPKVDRWKFCEILVGNFRKWTCYVGKKGIHEKAIQREE
jgi:SAM-dependent methyltransferase